MSSVGFHLDRYRFDSIEAKSFAGEQEENQNIEMRFEVGFHEDEQPEGQFVVSLKLDLATRKGEERSMVLNVAAMGVFLFSPGVEPYPVKDSLERLYAMTLLYGCLRPTLDTIASNIGFNGLSMPLNLPLGHDGRLPEES